MKSSRVKIKYLDMANDEKKTPDSKGHNLREHVSLRGRKRKRDVSVVNLSSDSESDFQPTKKPKRMTKSQESNDKGRKPSKTEDSTSTV